MGRRITIMASQTEFRSAARPRFFAAGIRIDQTYNAAAMPAVVMA